MATGLRGWVSRAPDTFSIEAARFTDGGWNSDGPARVSWAGVSAVVSARRPDRTRHGRRSFDIGDDEQV